MTANVADPLESGVAPAAGEEGRAGEHGDRREQDEHGNESQGEVKLREECLGARDRDKD